MALDRQSLIEALTDGVGVHFGRASRRSFFEQLDGSSATRFAISTPEERTRPRRPPRHRRLPSVRHRSY